MNERSAVVPVVPHGGVGALLGSAELAPQVLRSSLRSAFADLVASRVRQTAQQTMLLSGGGDCITYQAALLPERVMATKVSPYLPWRPVGARVTAWTLLMSIETGQPLMLVDALALTAQRTAATTALALEYLFRPQLGSALPRVALLGTGPVGLAHLRHTLDLVPGAATSVFSPSLADDADDDRGRLAAVRALSPEARVCSTAKEAVEDADIVLLCTSSSTPVIDPVWLSSTAVVTSVASNGPGAHEMPAQALRDLDVFCDLRSIATEMAADFRLAADQHGWQPADVLADLPQMSCGDVPPRSPGRPAYFRSVGLGIEDAVIAYALYQAYRRHTQISDVPTRGASA